MRMTRRFLLGGLMGLAIPVLVTTLRPEASLAAFHFALTRSAPEAGASVPSPEEVRLWFTQAPQENSVSIRLVDAAGNAVSTGEVVSDDSDGQSVAVSVGGVLSAGAYSVSWRGVGDDGHIVRGEFAFSVSAE